MAAATQLMELEGGPRMSQQENLKDRGRKRKEGGMEGKRYQGQRWEKEKWRMR